MGPYEFFRLNLAWVATVAMLWPINIPLAALAYKIRQGHTPIRMESSEFWLRCTFAPLLLAFVTAGFLGLDYYLAEEAGMPAGLVHMVITVAYAAAAWWLYFIMFALEDPFQGLSTFLIYVYLPIAVLFPINALLHWWDPLLKLALAWLKPD